MLDIRTYGKTLLWDGAVEVFFDSLSAKRRFGLHIRADFGLSEEGMSCKMFRSGARGVLRGGSVEG